MTAPASDTALTPIGAAELRAVRHGFFTREGGVSTGIYATLNGGPGSADRPDAVAENRARIAAALGASALVSVAQVHGAEVRMVTAPWRGPRPEADAMVTDRPGLALAVLTADCAPVLMADVEAGVVAAAHAGWKGALAGVLEATVAAMARLGARPERVRAAIGPTISQAAYEVGPDFVARFLDADPDTARFFAGGRGDRAQFDLPGYALSRLRAAGVEARWTGQCTYRDPARFFSYRRACHAGEGDYGRLVSAVALEEAPR